MSKRFNTQRMVTIALLAAMSVILVYIVRFPIFAAVPFLEYDPADIPILICTFALGPIEGLVLTVIVSILQGFTVSSASGMIGIAMHIFATGSFVLAAGTIYHKKKTIGRAIVALCVGTMVMTLSMVAWNLLVTPLFLGMPVSAVMALLPAIIGFNLIKAGLNGVLTLLVYKQVERVFIPEKGDKINRIANG